MLTYALAVLAACANATSSVLQRKANREAPQQQNLSLRLIWTLAHQPVWFGGVATITVGFLLQAAALGSGELSVVEPILVLELPATLILASRVFGTRLRRREWGSIATMTAGLAGLLYFLSPTAAPSEHVRWYGWTAGIGINLAFVAVMVAWGRCGPVGRGGKGGRRSPRWRRSPAPNALQLRRLRQSARSSAPPSAGSTGRPGSIAASRLMSSARCCR